VVAEQRGERRGEHDQHCILPPRRVAHGWQRAGAVVWAEQRLSQLNHGQPKEHRYGTWHWHRPARRVKRETTIDDVLCVQVQVDLRMGEVYAFRRSEKRVAAQSRPGSGGRYEPAIWRSQSATVLSSARAGVDDQR